MNREQEKVARLLRRELESIPKEFVGGPGDNYNVWRKQTARIFEYVGGLIEKDFNFASNVIRTGSIYGGGLSAPVSDYERATEETKKVILETIELAENGILPIKNALPTANQKINQRISLSQSQEQNLFLTLREECDEETQAKINELHNELSKKKRDKTKIKKII